MTEPMEAVYDTAYEAFKRAPLGSSIVRAIVDHVWPLAVAEGRRQSVADIVAEAHERRRLAKDALDRQHDGDDQAERHRLRFLAQAVALERGAAHIAEGTDHA